jgi:hypothetical protein
MTSSFVILRKEPWFVVFSSPSRRHFWLGFFLSFYFFFLCQLVWSTWTRSIHQPHLSNAKNLIARKLLSLVTYFSSSSSSFSFSFVRILRVFITCKSLPTRCRHRIALCSNCYSVRIRNRRRRNVHKKRTRMRKLRFSFFYFCLTSLFAIKGLLNRIAASPLSAMDAGRLAAVFAPLCYRFQLIYYKRPSPVPLRVSIEWWTKKKERKGKGRKRKRRGREATFLLVFHLPIIFNVTL